MVFAVQMGSPHACEDLAVQLAVLLVAIFHGAVHVFSTFNLKAPDLYEDDLII